MNHSQGNLFVISAPSGTGKTSLVKALVESVSGITVSISHTTRPQRPGEVHELNYYFIEPAEFQRMVDDGEFFEHAQVFNNSYGTSRRWVSETLSRGLDVILEIDWQGCQQIKTLFPECISIFILPPSQQALAERLINRNQDHVDIIQARLADVRESASHINEFDYVVMNDDFKHAMHDLKTIIESGRLLQKRQVQKYAKLLTELCQLQNLSTTR